MPTNVPLPALGESVTEGTISRWLKAVGDTVEADEALVEVSTDKVDTEIPSPVAGTVLEIKFEEDDVAEVGAILAVIGEPGEAAGGGDAPAAPTEEKQEVAETAAEQQAAPADPSAGEQPASTGSAPGGAPSGAASGTEVTLPALGESVTEGTISRWLKEVGDTVEADEALVEVSTDKVDTEIPSPVAGTLLEIRVNEDETAEVGAVLAIVGDANAAAADEAPAAPAEEAKQPEDEAKQEQAQLDDTAASVPAEGAASQAEEENSEKAAPQAQQEAPAAAPRRAAEAPDTGYVTPLVRKLAGQHGVDLNTVRGTGVGRRIRKQDVLAAAEAAKAPKQEAPAAAPAAPAAPAASAAAPAPKADPAAEAKRGTTEKMSRLRKIIASRMVESLQVSAQLTATVEVDLTNISKIRAKVKDAFKAREGASLSYLPFIAKAAIEGLKQFPKLNAQIDSEAGEIHYRDAEHVGIAVDTERGLLVPVVKDAGDLNVTGLAKKIADIAARTRTNKVGPDELSGGTFTITNYGSAGTLFDTPIVNQPEVAILGTGALVKRPVVLNDPELGEVIAIRDMMYLSLSYDHRLVDGADAARFLSFVKARLEEGDFGAEFGA
ncbi:2-oxoglutarate dehydrogenase, E2 component, dihydrolipoamide succinyltransferase [Propioniciclava sinopodophylli]|uniref:Dihydrolipoamide acetyltransferase component of pyruvate dehydrogenase complex n=1 Tax=Propioniciclava sinopodophylli TaxID=1837344 RepID=A0A4Q9KI06_9ACTN|nr:2-oxoglutarate dehydrogenase, E2 component, dihydrolipoamide succinyltransferase [Propioniciclava sinopodophylli]TBT87335.1 2-oxoglutarate dehydrogenase, E2 component, dihydrolipoamide succinyltransferase [Propioniciclava sinopodophylli]